MRHLDLFSGIGGFALAAEWAGFETTMFCEIDPFCQRVLRKHWPHVPIHDDIRTLPGELVGDIELVTGGFPCQPFSVAGKRRGAADDRHLWPEMARLIDECRPRWVLGENTPGIIGLALDDCCADLEGLGYDVWPVVVPACGVGAWHKRERVWIVAYSGRELLEGIGVAGTTARATHGSASTDAASNAERGGWREPMRTHSTQRALPPSIGAQGASGLGSGGADAANAARELPHGIGQTRNGWSEFANGGDQGRTPDHADCGRHEPSNGWLQARRDGALDADWWELESRVRPVPNGLSAGVVGRSARLKALGNSIVPQVAYALMAAMAVVT